MSNNTTTHSSMLGKVKDVVGLTKEIIVIALVLCVVFNPSLIGNYICESGLTQIDVFGFKAAKECLKKITSSQLASVNESQTNQTLAQQIQEPVKPEVALTISAAEKSIELPDKGWIYLGQVTDAGKKWSIGSPVTVITEAPPTNIQNSTLTLKKDTYLRAEVSQGSRSAGRIISVLRIGDEVKVENIDTQSQSGMSDKYLWAKVHKLQQRERSEPNN